MNKFVQCSVLIYIYIYGPYNKCKSDPFLWFFMKNPVIKS